MDENVSGISKAFLANFVHQVVNPLNGVIGTLDNIVDGTYVGDVASNKINACRAQVEQCVTLIRNLAYLSEYFGDDVPSPSLKAVRTNALSVLPQVVIEAMQFFQVSADRKDVKLGLDDSQMQYKIHVRPELLRQVFINLFDNWVKYGVKGSRISVTPSVNSKDDLVVEMSGESEVPPLKWSILRYGFSKEDHDGKKEAYS